MPNKIQQKLKQLAKKILEVQEPYDYQKVYDATLLLFEHLILIKNAEGFNKGLLKDFETKLDQSLDFIKVQQDSETTKENFNEGEELPPKVEIKKEIVKEIVESKPFVAELFQESTKELSFERKEDTISIQKESQKRLNDKFSKGLQVGLNDRLAFIKHLFHQNTEDYQRAISQIATLETWEHAQKFILENKE